MTRQPWLCVERGEAPLLISLPHTGVTLPPDCRGGLVSLARARFDTDWWVDLLYDFTREMGATVVHTAISRTVIDVNRDPSGASLYPGQATTALCPTTTFDGLPLYEAGQEPDDRAIAHRLETYFRPYHAALAAEIARLRALHPRIVVYDCHSIRSVIPRLFEGVLPYVNIGTNDGAACAGGLTRAVEAVCQASPFASVTNGRFKGGFITRALGRPDEGIHAIQIELACRGYMRETIGPLAEEAWPTAWDPDFATPLRAVLRRILHACLTFARTP